MSGIGDSRGENRPSREESPRDEICGARELDAAAKDFVSRERKNQFFAVQIEFQLILGVFLAIVNGKVQVSSDGSGGFPHWQSLFVQFLFHDFAISSRGTWGGFWIAHVHFRYGRDPMNPRGLPRVWIRVSAGFVANVCATVDRNRGPGTGFLLQRSGD